jgi:hypothetical protein
MTIGIDFAVYELTMWAAYIKGKKLGISAEKGRQRSLGNATVLAVGGSIILGSSLSINKVITGH